MPRGRFAGALVTAALTLCAPGPARPASWAAVGDVARRSAADGESSPPAEATKRPASRRTLIDALGRTVTFAGTPQRIVALAPSVTEMLFAIGAGERLVGVSDFCRVPEGGPAPARVGGLINPDLERIVSLKPDLAVATTSGNYVEDADRIERLGIPVYTCDTPDVDSVLRTLEDLGRITGAERQASALAAALRERLVKVEDRVRGRARPKVLFAVWGEPVLAPGRGAFINDALRRAGAESVSAGASARWTEYDLEQILAARPDVVLTVPDNRSFAESLPTRAGWAPVPAVKNGRVHIVGDAIQQPGPGIVDAIEEIARLLHPE